MKAISDREEGGTRGKRWGRNRTPKAKGGEEKVQGKSREQGCGTREWSNRVIKRDWEEERKGGASLWRQLSMCTIPAPVWRSRPPLLAVLLGFSVLGVRLLPVRSTCSFFRICACSLSSFLFFFMLPTGPVFLAYCRMLAREPGLSSPSSVPGSLASPRRVSSCLVSSRSTWPFLRFL